MTALEFSMAEVTEFVGALLWPLFRVAAFFSIVPVLGAGQVPMRIRVGLSFLVTLLLLPNLGPVPAIDPLTPTGMFITLQQMAIGFAMGFMILIVFNTMTMAGESIAITMGLGFALLNDPQNGAQVPTVSQFYLVFATLLFLALGGHFAVLKLVSASFVSIPIGEGFAFDSIWHLLNWAAILWQGALAIALPALAAMLAVNMIMGVITRAAPAMNLFSIGFPITMTIGFIAMLLTLPTVKYEFELLLNDALASIITMLAM